MRSRTFFLVSALSVLFLSGCSSTPQTKKEVGRINFAYTPQSTEQKTNNIIAIVTPSFKTSQQALAAKTSINPLLAAAFSQQPGYKVDFNQGLSSYKNRLVSSMDSSFNEIVISKGFNISGPYDTFDDITYTDKKSSYLALTPNINVYIEQKPTSQTCVASENYCEDVGTIQVGGSLTIKLIEPMTKQTFLSKRINLSEISEERSYVKRKYYKGPSKGLMAYAIGAAIDAASGPVEDKPLIDNTDKVMAEVLNEFYTNAMQKVDIYLSQEEILSFQEDVAKVKGLKRF